MANVAIGYVVATQLLVFPIFGLSTTLAAIFTALSIVRSYALRRMFEAVRTWGA